MIVQLLMLEGYINTDDLAHGSVIEKVNRETIAAAKYAVVQYLTSLKEQKKATAPTTDTVNKSASTGTKVTPKR